MKENIKITAGKLITYFQGKRRNSPCGVIIDMINKLNKEVCIK